MRLDVTAALVVFLAVPFGCGCVVDPFAGADRYLYVPDASPTAVPINPRACTCPTAVSTLQHPRSGSRTGQGFD